MARYGQTINSDLLGYYTAEQSVTKNQLAGVDYWTEDNQGAYFPRPGTADEIANVAELLMSEKGAFITGTDFLIDGGATASYFYGPLQPET
mgnify:CR=1 FL=1